MKRMPTLKSIDPKTKDGAEFLRALKKHREFQDLEGEEAARTALLEKEEEESSDNNGAENGVNGQDAVVDAQDGNR